MQPYTREHDPSGVRTSASVHHAEFVGAMQAEREDAALRKSLHRDAVQGVTRPSPTKARTQAVAKRRAKAKVARKSRRANR